MKLIEKNARHFTADELFSLENNRSDPDWSEINRRIKAVNAKLKNNPAGLDTHIYACLGGSDSEYLKYARLRGQTGDSGAAVFMPESLATLRVLKEKFPDLFR